MTRCDLCPGVNNLVPPSGPYRNDYVFIGEAPGKDEDKKREPFVGKTGREVNEHYLPLIGRGRPTCYFTNAIKCLPNTSDHKLEMKDKKDMALLESCAAHHLYPEIERIQPKLLIPMGAFACRAVDPAINLELQHGFPVKTRLGMAFPMYHPAGAIHEPKKMLQIRGDWIRLGKFMKNKLRVQADPFTEVDYSEVMSPDEILGMDPWSDLACDTETTRKRKPFCLTYSNEIGTGRLIRADSELLADFQHMISKWKGRIVFHNWLFDYGVVSDMGLVFPHKRIVDTMKRSFHMGNLPQGLKALSYRVNGMIMQDFDDLVTPHSTELVLDYYRQAYCEEWDKPEPIEERQKDGTYKLKNPQGMHTKLKRFFTDFSKNPEKDVFAMWNKNWVDEQAMVEDRCGEWPGKCITHAPFDQVLYYACRDADATLRLWPWLRKARNRVRRVPEYEWMNVEVA